MFKISILSADRSSFNFGAFPSIFSGLSGAQKCLVLQLRDEVTFDCDTQNDAEDAFASTSIRLALSEFGQSSFLVLGKQNSGFPNRVKTYKGALRKYPDLMHLPSVEIEVPLPSGETAHYAAVDGTTNLEAISRFERSDNIFLSADITIGTFSKELENWKSDGYLPFNYREVVCSIAKRPGTVLLKYDFADNGRAESITFVGELEALEWKLKKLTQQIRSFLKS